MTLALTWVLVSALVLAGLAFSAWVWWSEGWEPASIVFLAVIVCAVLLVPMI